MAGEPAEDRPKRKPSEAEALKIRKSLLRSRFFDQIEDKSKLDEIIATSAVHEHYPAGEFVIVQGDKNDLSVFVIESGELEIYVGKTHGIHSNDAVLVNERRAGDRCGELSFVHGQARGSSYRVKSEGGASLWRVPDAELDRLVREDGGFGKAITRARWMRRVVDKNVLFEQLDDEKSIDDLLQKFEPVALAAGTAITKQFTEGDDKFYIIQSGACEVLVQKGDDAPQRVGKLMAGESFGELSLLFGKARTATIVTTEPTIVLRLDAAAFHAATDKQGARYLQHIFNKHASVKVGEEQFMSVADFERVLEEGFQADRRREGGGGGGRGRGGGANKASAKLIFRLADMTGAQLISFSEFVLLGMLLEKPNPEYEIAFRFFDTNKNGLISRTEFVEAVRAIMRHRGGDEAAGDFYMDDQLLQRLFGPDGTDELSYEEFEELLHSGHFPEMVNFWSSVTDDIRRANETWLHASIDGGLDESVSMSTPPTTSKQTHPWSYLVSGAVAGAISRTAVSPLIRLKMLMQTQSQPPKYTGIVQGMRLMLKEDGVRGFYRGNGSNVVRIAPTSAFQFFFFETYQQWIKNYHGGPDVKISTFEKLMAGGCAGITAATLTYPLDFIRARLTVQCGENPQYKGIFDGIRTVARKDGVRALYRGWWPTMVGVFPYIGIDFAVYSECRPFIPKNDDGQPQVLGLLAVGGFAGLVSQTIAFPLELVRRRLQVQGFTKHNTYDYSGGIWDALKKTVQKDGCKGLYRGNTANYLKAVPSIGISFVVYEKMKFVLNIC